MSNRDLMDSEQAYDAFTPKLMWQEVAPHTWPASILPVLAAVCLACSGPNYVACGVGVCYSGTVPVSLSMTLVLLAISVLMQSCVNVLNDYFDYVKGVDTVENSSDDVTDAVLVYNNLNPKSVLAFAVGLLVTAFLLGIYVIYHAGFIPLVIALIGAAIVFLYSGGKTPISYLPIGELVSGFVMGALICLASYYSLTKSFDWMVLLYALPLIIGIGLIMMTNNTCDIDKDIEAGRKTLPVLLGHDRALKMYHALIVIWIAAICLLSVLRAALYNGFEVPGDLAASLILVPFMLLTAYPQLRALWRNPMVPASRDGAMPQILSVNITLNVYYALMLALPCAVNFVL